MLWQGELFLVLKIDGGRLGGSREGGVDFLHEEGGGGGGGLKHQ